MAGYGREALEELRDVVRVAKGDDPLTPVTVLVPNNIAGIVARRFLARGLGDGHHGVAALYPTTIARLAEQLAAPVLHDRLPATGPVFAAAWRAALHKDAGVFDAVKDHPSTVQALVRASRELRDLDGAGLDALSTVQPLGPDLVRLHRSVVADLASGWYDQTDLLHSATEVCRTRPDKVAEIGAVVLYLPQALDQAESAFVAALGANSTVHVVAGLTGRAKADAAVHRTLTRIGAFAPNDPATPTATRVLTASDADDEVRCVVREVVAALEKHPAHRVAVLYATQNPYARLLHEHLGAAGITINGPGTRPVHERAVSRAVLELLDLAGTGPERDVPRSDLFRVLATAPMRAPDGERVPIARWERLSRSAGIVSGADWASRLAVFLQEERDRLADEEAREDIRPGVVARLTTSIVNADRLQAFVGDLRKRLDEGRQLGSWRELSAWALQLMHDLIGQAAQLTTLPPEEQYAAVAVEQALGGLAVLDSFDGAQASLTALREIVASQLEAALPRVGRFGDGVLVAPMSMAIGLEVDAAFVLGLAESTFPGRLREDPLLPERAREATAGQLLGYREQLDRKHRQLLAAFAAAPAVLASFPRGDLRTKSQHLPSRWLLPTMQMLSGRPDLSATEWDALPTGWMTTSASFAGSLIETPRPASEQEWRTRAAHAGTAPPDPVADAANELLRARASSQFTRYDGNLSAVEGLPDHADGTAVISPTALERYARCPHAYFIERLLGVEPIELPEDVIAISPADIGTLMHNSFDRLVREFADNLPTYGQPWSDEQQHRLAAIAQEEADRFAAEGRTGHPRLWEQTLSRIKADLRAMLISDHEWRAEHRAAVIASELAFGMRGAEPVAIPLPDGSTVLMRGAADKVDRDVDGRLYVTDIKSGKADDFRELSQSNPVAGGTKLQLPVYAHAVRAAYDPEAEVEAAYWFVRRDKGRIELPLTESVERTYAEALQTIVTGIRGGLFPERPPIDPDYAYVQCAYCNPDGIGHAEARRRWEQKKQDPRLGDLVGLIEPLPNGGAA